jgi:hypothetical protein
MLGVTLVASNTLFGIPFDLPIRLHRVYTCYLIKNDYGLMIKNKLPQKVHAWVRILYPLMTE